MTADLPQVEALVQQGRLDEERASLLEALKQKPIA